MKIGSHRWKEQIRTAAAALGVETADEQLDAFSLHAHELLFWNRRTNLTAITDPEQLAIQHFADSMAPARFIPPHAALLDIGSGGGFPGIPLKVVLPGLSVTLIDAVRKKVSFLAHVLRRLGLSGIEAAHIRAELLAFDLKRKEKSSPRFDVVISRALRSPEALLPSVLPLLRENGIILLMRGKTARPGPVPCDRSGVLETVDVFDYRLPGLASERSIWRLKPASTFVGISTEEGT